MAAMARPAARVWHAYCNQLVRRPLMSRCFTGFAGAVVSDAAAQLGHRAMAHNHAQEGQSHSPHWQYDWWRSARLALYRFAVGTPIAFKWFALLDKVSVRVPLCIPGRDGDDDDDEHDHDEGRYGHVGTLQ